MTYTILLEPQAINDLRAIYRFIAQNDSPKKAEKFLGRLKEKIQALGFMPYKHRKSMYHEDETIRDMIFKGYTVVYHVGKSTIHVVAVFRQKNF
jgi:plasmid stabilization system protein ParE